MAALAALFSLLAVYPASAGRMYKYVDSKGVEHWVQDKDKIPTKYRDQVESKDVEAPRSATPPPAAAPAEGDKGTAAVSGAGAPKDVDLTGLPPDIDPATVVGRDKDGKFLLDPTRPQRLKAEQEKAAELQKKQKLGQADKEGHDEAYWRSKVADCQNQQRRLEDDYRKANESYSGGTRYGSAADANHLKQLKDRADAKRAECEKIPLEAKKAGAPPGWVR
ncbi:MAG: hypothetical protein AB1405_17670 [Bdellovibrionota bacterium]